MGRIVAISGKDGVGKTTVSAMMARLYAAERRYSLWMWIRTQIWGLL